MKQHFLLFALLLSSLGMSSQHYSQFYVNHQNDTVPCKIVSFSNKKIYIVDNGRLKSLNTRKIKAFSSFEGNKYRNFVTLKNDKSNLYEEELIGKLSLYKLYTVYQREPTIVMVKNDEIFHLTLLNYRSRSGQLIADCEPVYKLWLEKKFRISDPATLVNLYNYYMTTTSGNNG